MLSSYFFHSSTSSPSFVRRLELLSFDYGGGVRVETVSVKPAQVRVQVSLMHGR